MTLFIRHKPEGNVFELVQRIEGLNLEVIIESNTNKDITLKRYKIHLDKYAAKPGPMLLELKKLPPNSLTGDNNESK